MDIVEFLTARYAEEAKRWQTIWRFKAGDSRIDGYWSLGGTFGHAVNAVVDTTHGGRELAAKRAIVRICNNLRQGADPDGEMLADETLRNFAAVYAEHPDYDPAWRVDT